MEWKYTRTERSMQEAFLAAATRRGTRARRAVLRQDLLLAAVFAGAMLVVLHPWRMTPAERAAAWVMLGIYSLIYLLLAATGAQRYAWSQMRALRSRDLLQNALGPQTVRLSAEGLVIAGGQLGGTGEFRCPFIDLLRAEAARGGVLVVRRDGRVEFLPPEAFCFGQTVPACVNALNAAIAAAGQGAAPGPAEAPPVRQGFAPDGSGGGTLTFALELRQAADLYKEANLRLMGIPGYWTGQWRSLVPLALVALGILLLAGAGALLAYLLFMAGITAAAVALVAFGPARTKGLETICGPQTLCLRADGIHVERPNGRWDFRYEEFSMLLETKNGVFFYKPRKNIILAVPKAAFRSPQEQADFCALARARMG